MWQVAALAGFRNAAQLAVSTQQLYVYRLALGVLEGEALGEAVGRLRGQLGKIDAHKEDLDQQAERWHEQVG